MGRRGLAAHAAPSTRNGPLDEYADETWAQWVRRQQHPPKPNTPAVRAIATATAKKKAPESAATDLEGVIPEGNL